MRKFIGSRLAMMLTTATMLTLGGLSTALATTGTGSQNQDFTVSVSAASVGTADPDVATVGNTVRVVLSVRNNKSWTGGLRPDDVQLRVTLQTPLDAPYTVSFTISMYPGQTLQLPLEFTVSDSFPRGAYALTLEAIEVRDPAAPVSSATATLTIM
jgi:hypothetical protein